MGLSLTILSNSSENEKNWTHELQGILKGLVEVQSHRAPNPIYGQIVFIDSSMGQVDSILSGIDRSGRAVFLVVDEHATLPLCLQEGRVDDVVVTPFRPLEVLSKLRHYEQILVWNEVMEVSASFSEALQKLSEDLGLAERLQKAKVPRRFQEVKGFRVSSRYLAGMRSGGDHFDLAESKDGTSLSIILSNSSSYGLSSAVLSTLMRVTVKLAADKIGKEGGTIETVRQVYEDLLLTLGEKDQLSLFYGTISRQEQVLRFLNLGSASAFYADANSVFDELPHQGDAISSGSGFTSQEECKISLSPEGRLILVSSGFINALGGITQVHELLNRFRQKEASDLMMELTFLVKSKLTEEEMPDRDCTVIIFDADSRVLRLAKREPDEI